MIVGPPYDGLIAYYSGDDDKDDVSANQDKIIKSRDHSDKVVISTNTPLSPNSRFLGLFTVERSFGKKITRPKQIRHKFNFSAPKQGAGNHATEIGGGGTSVLQVRGGV